MRVKVKRVYEPVSHDDGYRLLVDRLWARGIRKGSPKLNKWLKDISPSLELMKWYHEDPDTRWSDFQRKYKAELKVNKEAVAEIKKIKKDHPNLTIVYASRNTEHNNAVVLAKYLSTL